MVANGKDGWSLEDYTWDPATGLGTFTYEREIVDTGEIAEYSRVKPQPHAPTHVGWYTGARK